MYKKNKRITCFFVVTFPVIVVCMYFVFYNQKTDNVFDQLYLEVKTVQKGGDSVLISGTESAYADYDFGQFENIQIPECDMCLDIDDKSLYLLFFNSKGAEKWDTSYCILYRYDMRNKKLYGESSIDYLADNFLSDYLQWCNNADNANEYSLNGLGEYSFTYQETVNYN